MFSGCLLSCVHKFKHKSDLGMSDIECTVKRHFYAREKFMRICQNGPLDKFMRFLFMRSSALCIVMYGVIKFMRDKFMRPALDSHNSHKKSHAEICYFRVCWSVSLYVNNYRYFLQFEWAWQHPAHSRRLGKAVAKRRSKESPFQYRFRVLSEMLVVGPWCRLPLTIR